MGARIPQAFDRSGVYASSDLMCAAGEAPAVASAAPDRRRHHAVRLEGASGLPRFRARRSPEAQPQRARSRQVTRQANRMSSSPLT
jgi:hypothetical protein